MNGIVARGYGLSVPSAIVTMGFGWQGTSAPAQEPVAQEPIAVYIPPALTRPQVIIYVDQEAAAATALQDDDEMLVMLG